MRAFRPSTPDNTVQGVTHPTSAPGRPRTAVAVAVAAVTPAVAGAVLVVASRVPVTADLLFLLVDVTVAVVYGTVAAVVLSRRVHPVAWLVALAAVGGGVSALGGGWGAWGAAHPGTAAPEALAMTFGWAWVPGTLALFLVVPWLVREEPPGRLERAGLTLGVVVTVSLALQRLLLPLSDTTALLLAAVLTGLLTAAATAWRRWRGPLRERPGLGLLALGTALMALSFLPLVWSTTPDDLLLAVPLTHLVCQALFPGALLVTVLRNRLWGIDLVVSRAVLLGLLTVGLVTVYAGLVWATTALAGSSAVAQVVAAVGVVLAVQPVRARLDVRVRRLVYGDAPTPGRAALHLGARLSDAGTDDLLSSLAAGVGEALHLESVTLTLADDPAARGTWGDATAEPATRTVHRAGRPAGTVAFTARPGERLDARTHQALDALLPVVGAGLDLVQGARALARARDAATRARLAERRVIRRELHDGIGPWLTGLRLGLQGARNALPADPATADTVLATLQAQVVQRIEDVRTLSRTLLPPALDQEGLAAAVGELVRNAAADGFVVETAGALTGQGAALRDVRPHVAAAAYAIAAEAVTNAARHSGAPGCRLEVHRDDGTLVVVCTDTGRGRAPGTPDGVGTRSMRERAEELGGTLSTAAGPSGTGTRVTAHLPLARAVVPA